MAHSLTPRQAVIQQQLNELDALAAQTLQDLNTVAGTERVAKWKVRTVALLIETMGREVGREFADLHPGQSFTNDMLEEFTDLIDCYRTPLAALIKRLTEEANPSIEG